MKEEEKLKCLSIFFVIFAHNSLYVAVCVFSISRFFLSNM